MNLRSNSIIAALLLTVALPAHGTTIEFGPLAMRSGTFSAYGYYEFSNLGYASSDEQELSKDPVSYSISVDGNAASGYANFDSLGVFGSVTRTDNGSSSGVLYTTYATSGVFDVLTFDFEDAESGLVAFDLSFDGVLRNTTEDAGAGVTLVINDVTDLASAFTVYEVPGRNTSNNANLLFPTGEFVDDNIYTVPTNSMFNGQSDFSVESEYEDWWADEGLVEGVDFVISSDGLPVHFGKSLVGEFTAVAGREYAFMMRVSASASVRDEGEASANLLSTAKFSFTNLSGGSFESASGLFLADDEEVAPVPLPGAIGLLLAGLAGLGVVSGRRSGSREAVGI